MIRKMVSVKPLPKSASSPPPLHANVAIITATFIVAWIKCVLSVWACNLIFQLNIWCCLVSYKMIHRIPKVLSKTIGIKNQRKHMWTVMSVCTMCVEMFVCWFSKLKCCHDIFTFMICVCECVCVELLSIKHSNSPCYARVLVEKWFCWHLLTSTIYLCVRCEKHLDKHLNCLLVLCFLPNRGVVF